MRSQLASGESQNVEDVLASIRKLVSEEAKDKSARLEDPVVQAPAASPLLLTPELKVEEKPEPLELSKTHEVAPESDKSPDSASAAPFQDEVALRSLIREVLREELQGELGTRITRNVRALIRKEIENTSSS